MAAHTIRRVFGSRGFRTIAIFALSHRPILPLLRIALEARISEREFYAWSVTPFVVSPVESFLLALWRASA